MNKGLMRAGALVFVIVMALGVIGTAAAQDPGDDPGDTGGVLNPLGPRDRVGRALLQAVVDATGMTGQEVLAALRDGQTLTDVLTEQGIDPQTVVDIVTAQVNAEVAERLANGTLTEEQAARILENLGPALERAMTATLPARPTPVRDRLADLGDNTLLSVLAEMAGMEPGELVREALTPPTLAEIADSYGLDAEAIISATEAQITEEVNQAVEDGRLTEEQAALVLDGLHDRLVERFNSPLGQFGVVRDRIGDSIRDRMDDRMGDYRGGRMRDRFPNMRGRSNSPIL